MCNLWPWCHSTVIPKIIFSLFWKKICNSYINLSTPPPGDERWTTATYCIDECVIVKALASDTVYRFRVSAINKFGQSPYSWATVEVRTKKEGGSMILLFFLLVFISSSPDTRWKCYIHYSYTIFYDFTRFPWFEITQRLHINLLSKVFWMFLI